METHAHHLHKAPGKKFSHYFFEFLMLFIAVFCGFLAENYREHKVESERENVYMKNMLEDLSADTSSYSKYDIETKKFTDKIDSLLTLMKSPERNAHLNTIYFLARTMTLNNSFLFTNDRTFEQMKSTGYLRVIKNQQVADSVSSYYHTLNMLKPQNDIIKDRISDYMNGAAKIFDAQIFLQILKDRQEPASVPQKLLSEDPAVMNELLVRAQYFYGARLLQNMRGIATHAKADNLIELINKEYRFK